MASIIKMPSVAAGSEEAVLSKWLVPEGTTVSVGDLIAEIETEKAIVDYAAEEAGILAKQIVAPGKTIEVGAPIAILLQAGEDISAADPLLGGAAPEVVAEPVVLETVVPSAIVHAPPASEHLNSPIAQLPEPAQESTQGRVLVSPLVRRMARELGINLSSIQGTGPGGRKVRRDLERAQSLQSVAAPIAVPESQSKDIVPQENNSAFTGIPHSGMRKAIARRLTESKSSIPHFYLSADCDVDALLALRANINLTSSKKISVNDFVVKAVAAAFQDVPDANVVWTDTQMLRYETVDISVAVATKGGLLTPVIRGCEKRSLSNLSIEIATLAEKARDGKLRQEELEGGSFAITNLGMYGTKEFSAIINPPQSGILAVGAASPRPIVIDGEIVVRSIMTVTLSADHRAVDGALAAQWLSAFQQRIENPLSMLI
jgi:pyruvate dehydrogenase E2 component (dihydrolipoamide acetyltransferase)